jgi:hypothetical protein
MKTLSVLLLITLSANQSFARGYNRTGVDGDQLVLLYAAVAALMLLIGFAPEIRKYIKQHFPNKQHFAFIPLLTTLSGEGKSQLIGVVLAFAALLFTIAYTPTIVRYIKQWVFHKQHPSH